MTSSPEELDHEKREHASRGASSCERWWHCAGTFRLQEQLGIESTTSKYAAKGTALHQLAHMCLLNGQDAIEYISRSVFDLEVREEDANAVQIYLDKCRQYFGKPRVDCFTEKRFTLRRLNPPTPMFGTADFVAVDYERKHLTVIDLKTGVGVVVEIEDNKQLKYYALGALLSLPPDVQIDTIETIVVQPLAGGEPIRSATYKKAEILFSFGPELIDRARATLEPNAPCLAGPWCTSHFCPASGRCETQAQAAMTAAQLAFEGEPLAGEVLPPVKTPEIRLLTPQMLGSLLDAYEQVVEPFFKAAREAAKSLINSGSEVPGWQLSVGEGHRKWAVEGKVEEKLGQVFILPATSFLVTEVVSPARAEAIAIEKVRALGYTLKRAKQVVSAQLDPLVTRPPTAPQLTRVSTGRPGLPAPTDAFKGEAAPREEGSSLFA